MTRNRIGYVIRTKVGTASEATNSSVFRAVRKEFLAEYTGLSARMASY